MNIDKIKKEAMEVGLVTLYFLVCFSLFVVIKKLLLAEHHITFYGWATTIVGALAMGKIVFFIDKLSISKLLAHLKPIYEITLKALIYTIFVFMVSVLEKSFHYWLESPLEETLSYHLFADGKWAVLLANDLFIFFCFTIFFVHQFLNELLGNGEFVKRLFKKRTVQH